jgi:hypothetical protein
MRVAAVRCGRFGSTTAVIAARARRIGGPPSDPSALAGPFRHRLGPVDLVVGEIDVDVVDVAQVPLVVVLVRSEAHIRENVPKH